MAEQQKQYITPETKAKLEAELQALIDHRPVVAAEINERREEGDLKENAGYDAAREMQDQEEARIKQISEVLANSTTERAAMQEGVADIGSVVQSTTTATKRTARPSSSVPAPPLPTTRIWRPIPSSPRWVLHCLAHLKARPASTPLRMARPFQ